MKSIITIPWRTAAVPPFALLMVFQAGCVYPAGTASAQNAPAPPHASVSLLITVGPPPIPIYEQPEVPDEGYLWAPGYWARDEEGYYWVPGTWVMAPAVGLLWTPGYWSWDSDRFLFHTGYWSSHVGFYGGINYGHGYGGSGFDGGHWRGRNYVYNRAVTNVNITRVTHVYNTTVIVHNPSRTSYHSGAGGINARPTAQDQAAERDRREPLTTEQTRHHEHAGRNKELRASSNQGRPSAAATSRPAGSAAGNGAPARVPEPAREAVPRQVPKGREGSEQRGPEPNQTRTPPARTSRPNRSPAERSDPKQRQGQKSGRKPDRSGESPRADDPYLWIPPKK